MTTIYDLIRLQNEIDNAAKILQRYIEDHRAKNNQNPCHCMACELARAWLQRTR